MIYDYIVIGGGIVGMSTAWQLQRRCPDKKVMLLEKEDVFAKHQTGHNSGVIHAGVYYAPGSLKARFCREGAEATMAFCRENNIDYEQCGKLLVATTEAEMQRMQDLFHRCEQNGIKVEVLDQAQLRQKEPNIKGLGAILVKKTGIVNYRQITTAMAEKFVEAGGEPRLKTDVIGIEEKHDRVVLKITEEGKEVSINGRFLVSCSGLMADRLTTMMGIKTDFQIVPFRGEYYRLPKQHNDIVNHLIYPIPDPNLPFLGIHLTRMIDGSVTVGPNAVQGWKREGYGKFNFSPRDTWQMLLFKGFWRVMWDNLGTGLRETKNSWWKPGYLKQVNKYCPQLEVSDLQPHPAGVRAQAVMKDGSLIHDFLFAQSPRSLHVCNAPSPAATAAIPIGNYICDKILGDGGEPVA
jgi:L-2-hydroxyglutarate oxidase